ncbi:MAG: right-handed parallel beta-helix repeat-containing protein [Phycisphaerales bacterium]
MKTLDQVEPRIPLNQTTAPTNGAFEHVISQPGSYYLEGNITTAAPVGAVLITAEDVTLDLMGYRLNGQGVSATGIEAPGGLENIVVRNGTVTRFLANGVDLSGEAGSLVENVTVSDCDGRGFIASDGAILRNCRAIRVGLDAFLLTDGATTIACVAIETSPDGSSTSFNLTDSTAIDCTARNGGGDGFTLAGASRAAGCVAQDMEQSGFVSFATAVVLEQCQADRNVFRGFAMQGGGVLRSCAANDNSINIFAFNTTIDGCGVTGGTVGIELFRSVATNCSASMVGGPGFRLTRSTMRDSVAASNEVGALLLGRSAVLDCRFDTNAGDGVSAETGLDNRIEGNEFHNNGAYGIDIASGATRNLVYRNVFGDFGIANTRIIGATNSVGAFITAPAVPTSPYDNIQR